MEINQILIPERVREYPTQRGFDVPEAQIVSVEPFPIATEEEAPTPFIEANSAAVSWKELTEESILPSYADGGKSLCRIATSYTYRWKFLRKVTPL